MKKSRSVSRFAVAAVLSLSLAVASGSAAFGASTFHVAWTRIGIYPKSAPDMKASQAGTALSDGAPIDVTCEVTGTWVLSDVANSNIWEQLTNGSYLPNAFVETGATGWTPGIPQCDAPNNPSQSDQSQQMPAAPSPVAAPEPVSAPPAPASSAPAPISIPSVPAPISIPSAQAPAPAPAAASPAATPAPTAAPHYDRNAAAQWARNHYQGGNVPFIANCTVFVSAALHAGGIQATNNWQPSSTNADDQSTVLLFIWGWGHGPTKRWASADYLKNYLVNEQKIATITELHLGDKGAAGAQLGDLIMYDFAKEKTPGIIDHVAIVTGQDKNGAVVVTQKQDDQLDRVWDYSTIDRAKLAVSDPGTRAYLIHIEQ